MVGVSLSFITFFLISVLLQLTYFIRKNNFKTANGYKSEFLGAKELGMNIKRNMIGGGNGYPLQCSCLQNSMDRGT